MRFCLEGEVEAERWTILDRSLREITDVGAGVVDLRSGGFSAKVRSSGGFCLAARGSSVAKVATETGLAHREEHIAALIGNA